MRSSATDAPIPSSELAPAPIPMPASTPAPVPIPTPVSIPAPAYMPPSGVVADGVEQLPLYEPLPPLPPYERIAKPGEQRPVEMRDLERGEPSGATASHSGDPPGYQAATDTDGGDERVSVRRIDTDGSHVGDPPLAPAPAILYVRRAGGGFGPFSG